MRCDHCSAPDPDHPDAAKHGGVPVEGGACLVCRDYYSEFGYWPDSGQTQLGDL